MVEIYSHEKSNVRKLCMSVYGIQSAFQFKRCVKLDIKLSIKYQITKWKMAGKVK